jgi:hypothetical protein
MRTILQYEYETRGEAIIVSDGPVTQGKAGLPRHGMVLTRLPSASVVPGLLEVHAYDVR